MYIDNNTLYVPFNEIQQMGISAMDFLDSQQRDIVAKELVMKYSWKTGTVYSYVSVEGITNGCIGIKIK